MTTRTSRTSGFTLLETLVALSIVALLAGLATAWAAPLLRRARFSSAVPAVMGQLAVARGLAVREGHPVDLAIGDALFRFFSDGSAQGGPVAVDAGGVRREIRVDPISGRAHLLP